MRVLTLAARDWRNFEEVRLDCDGDFVVVHGDNGQGKTNLIEAVWISATLRSFREHSPSRMVRHGAKDAHVILEILGQSGRRKLHWARTNGQRKLQVDGKAPSSLIDWFRLLRAVLFCPGDGSMIRGEPSGRRRVMDRAAFTANPVHLDLIRNYQRVIKQKSMLLRSDILDPHLLDSWDEQIVELGAQVVLKRQQILDELFPPFVEMHQRIAGTDSVGFRVRSVGGEQHDRDSVQRCLREKLTEMRREEIRRGMVLVGPHRDDLIIELNGKSARNFASQGQVRSLVLAFKLAELRAAQDRGEQPLFLLDDLTSELDSARMQRLIQILGELDGQVWMSTTDPKWLGPLPGSRTVYLEVCDGMVNPP